MSVGELAAAEEEDGAPGADEPRASCHALGGPSRLDDDVRAPPVSRLGAEVAGKLAPLGPAADRHHSCPGVPGGRAQHQADRPGPEHGHRLAGFHLRPLDPAEATGERLHHRGDLRREAGRIDVLEQQRRELVERPPPRRHRAVRLIGAR